MKKIFAASVACLVAALLFWNWKELSLVAWADKTENDLLKETVLLSKRVKEFEKTLGIKPGPALSKSVGEQPASSILFIYGQKKCALALHRPLDIKIRAHFALPEENIPLEELTITADDMSFLIRRLDTFSDSRSVITPWLAKQTRIRKVEIIVHEDIHENVYLPLEQEEAIATPLAYFVAREFFKSIGDIKTVRETEQKIALLRERAQEMNWFGTYLEAAFQILPCSQARKKAPTRLATFPRYANMYWENIAKQNNILESLEAKVSLDFHYWKYFDAIISLHELGVPLKTLIADLKKSPPTHPEITKYFEKLEERYRKQYK